MAGAPGSGKTLLARAMPGILPEMSIEESLDVTRIYSVADQLPPDTPLIKHRPFRAPHHTISHAGLVGGGNIPHPGEISLAHRGVLFLDELPEFDRAVLEVLREPMESGQVAISRAARQAVFPARFQLVAAMNPCPCGHLGDPQGRCRCPPERVASYRARISGPLLDRIDLHVEVPRVATEELATGSVAESSADVAARVQAARELQVARQGRANAQLDGPVVLGGVNAEPEALRLLAGATRQLGLSARAYHRVLRVARTIADLAGGASVNARHVSEAITLRQLDRRVANGPICA
jgi:magnesium chelatase family protein